MPYIRDIPYISHFITEVHEVPVDHIKTYKRPAVSDMDIVVNRWPTDIHAYPAFQDGVKLFFSASDAVIDFQTHGGKNKVLQRGDQEPASELMQIPALIG